MGWEMGLAPPPPQDPLSSGNCVRPRFLIAGTFFFFFNNTLRDISLSDER